MAIGQAMAFIFAHKPEPVKYTPFIALYIFVGASCDTVTTAATEAASKAAKDAVNTEFERHTGIDSVSTRIGSLDTLNVEETIKQEVSREVEKQAEEILR
ncbi:hypothetical protein EFB08_17435 [Rufibacter latericius]|uniref:Uncharacterized protein n=2 Tax=Rufibacter latericius TaxID=2487040 RepID=A0A3M9MG37_9BACT|nr:hypothetical protein EFB08_17435 [Rufibacter latericius]